jgi:hypothetical protein
MGRREQLSLPVYLKHNALLVVYMSAALHSLRAITVGQLQWQNVEMQRFWNTF